MEKEKKSGLMSYFDALPRFNAPRREFIRSVSERCGVSEQTVRNWCIYGIKPMNFEHVRVLSELTGIPTEDLW